MASKDRGPSCDTPCPHCSRKSTEERQAPPGASLSWGMLGDGGCTHHCLPASRWPWGDVLFQMAEVHRQIQNQLEETLKSFHNELLTQLEQKVELDSRSTRRSSGGRGDALDKCQAELKKLRKKSQGSKNPQKYSDKELQVGAGPRRRRLPAAARTGFGLGRRVCPGAGGPRREGGSPPQHAQVSGWAACLSWSRRVAGGPALGLAGA
ncbi:hypothetical protein QTO34_008681 [Cnephaeus nilssonii]|uniref:IMD domain-containing protein n=1 Tax=Cnephaeus nilssonii TaxID=3371016 RepID=A0AA40HGJ9_CNENI|nr:hypothetical protein QTO34_008681 [Eptesicus nilssonii]